MSLSDMSVVDWLLVVAVAIGSIVFLRVMLAAIPLAGRASDVFTLLTIGIQTSFWVGLLVVSLVGVKPASNTMQMVYPYLQAWNVLAGIIYLTLCFVAGAFINRTSSVLYHMLRPRFIIPDFITKKAHAELGGDIRVEFALREGCFSGFLTEMTDKIHLLHSTIFNVILITASSLFLTFTHCHGVSCIKYSAGIIVVGFVLVLYGLVVLESQQISYEAREIQAKGELEKDVP